MDQTSHRSVSATLDSAPYATRISTRGLEILADEPADHGGLDLGFRPHELLLASLSACTAITLRMYAERKGWTADRISVHASMERTQHGRAIGTRIHLEVELPADMPAEQRERMLQIASACPVHRTLESPINLSSSLKA